MVIVVVILVVMETMVGGGRHANSGNNEGIKLVVVTESGRSSTDWLQVM